MKAKTFLELFTLSANLYTLSKDTQLMEKLKDFTEDGKDRINEFIKEKSYDEDGNEIEFVDKLVLKMIQAKEELEHKIGEVVADFYEKVNITHTDKIKELEEKINQLNKDLALAEARINHLENKG
jgi:polyhydroxyalkanoate synthesis regulator phasin